MCMYIYYKLYPSSLYLNNTKLKKKKKVCIIIIYM